MPSGNDLDKAFYFMKHFFIIDEYFLYIRCEVIPDGSNGKISFFVKQGRSRCFHAFVLDVFPEPQQISQIFGCQCFGAIFAGSTNNNTETFGDFEMLDNFFETLSFRLHLLFFGKSPWFLSPA